MDDPDIYHKLPEPLDFLLKLSYFFLYLYYLNTIEGEEIDQVMGEYTGGGIIFGRTGGVIEAALRTALENMTGEKIENVEFESLRGFDGFRACDVEVGDIKLRIGVAHGLEEAGKMLDKIRDGEEFFHAIEIMACPGGCVGG